MSEENERPRRGGTARIASDDNGHGEVRRTERLSPNGDDWSQREPVNPGWRRERTTSARTTRRRRSGLPTSPQEFQLWLQAGGWRYVAGITALLFVLLIALLAYGRNDQRDTRFGIEDQKAPTSFAGVGSALTPLALPTITVAPTLPPAPTFFTVTGTDGLGLFLRPNPSSEGEPLATLPDGTRVEQLGNDVSSGGFVWRKIKTTQGEEGWVAATFLTPAP